MNKPQSKKLKTVYFLQIKYDGDGTMYVEQVAGEVDKNHGEQDTDPTDGRMYQCKGIKIHVFLLNANKSYNKVFHSLS